MKGLRFQAGSKLSAEIIGRLFQFALIYAAQRILGPADYGVITYGLAVGVVLAPATDLGMQLIITREVARAERIAPRVSGIGLALKLLLTVGAVVVLVPHQLTAPRRHGLRHFRAGPGRHRRVFCGIFRLRLSRLAARRTGCGPDAAAASRRVRLRLRGLAAAARR